MAPNRGGFVYRGRSRTTESVVRRSKQSTGLYDSYLSGDVQMFKPREGENHVRILPQPESVNQQDWGDGWEIQLYVHFGIGPDEQAYLCLDKMAGKLCPPCEARREATDEQELRALRTSWRALCFVVDRNNEKAGVMAWSMPHTLFKEINGRSIDKKTGGVLYIDDPEEGYDVIFTREGTGLHTDYVAVEVDRDPTPLHQDQRQQQKWLDYVTEHPLPDMLQLYDAAHIEKVLSGTAVRRQAADEGGDDPAPARRAGARGRAEPQSDESEASTRRGTRFTRREPDEDSRVIEEQAEAPWAEDEQQPAEEQAAQPPPRGQPQPIQRRRLADPPPDDPPETTRRAPSQSAQQAMGRLRARVAR